MGSTDSRFSAVENGANALAEGFLFSVAAGLIISETWRQSNKASQQRDEVEDAIEGLQNSVSEMKQSVQLSNERWEEQHKMWEQERERSVQDFPLLFCGPS